MKSNQSDQKAQPKTNCILRFKDPKPNDKSIKAKSTESNGVEVTKQIRSRKTGNNEANLVALMNRMVSLGEMSQMWEDRKSRKLCQVMARALDGQAREDWQELVNEQNDDWDEEEQKRKFIQMPQSLGLAKFDPKAFKQ